MMYRDSLEKFVKENREAFDDRAPGLDVWAGIDASLRRRQAKRISLWRNVRSIAAALALLLIGGGIGSYVTQSQQNPVATIEEVAPEFMEMEAYFQQQINEKYQQLVAYEKEEMVAPDLNQLDQIMEELKQELAVAPRGKEEQIVENLILSYQAKIKILERVLERIQTPNQNQEDDEISI